MSKNGEEKNKPLKPKRRDRIETEEKLIRSGTEIFSRKGFEGTTVRDISEHSGVNMTLITRYFGGKEGLLLAIGSEFSKHKGNAELGYPPQNTLEEELMAYANWRFDEDVRQKDFIRVLIGRSAVDVRFRQKVRAIFFKGADPNLIARLERLKDRGEIAQEVELEHIYFAIAYQIFSMTFLYHIILGEDRKVVLERFEHFTRAYSKGIQMLSS